MQYKCLNNLNVRYKINLWFPKKYILSALGVLKVKLFQIIFSVMMYLEKV